MKLVSNLQNYTQVTSHSNEVIPQSIFVAVKGVSQDGHAFISDAQKRGAALIVGERDEKSLGVTLSIPYLQVENSMRTLSELACDFYQNPSHSMVMVGVTGTSGKTTNTYLIESLLNQAGFKTGVIGTIENRFQKEIIPSSLTTPGATELQKLLKEMKSKGCQAVVMEVSSHALSQYRAFGIAFDVMVFTNLSSEHLDYHQTMEEYFSAKSLLFTEYALDSIQRGKKPAFIINEEDEWGKKLLTETIPTFWNQHLHVQKPTILKYQVQSVLKNLKLSNDGIHGEIRSISLHSSLVGLFNVQNIFSALCVGEVLGLKSEVISQGISKLKGVPGRLEKVSNPKGIHAYVDYAHKPDALEKVLVTLRQMKGSGRLICIFGCGGDRDRSKRPQMGKISEKQADLVWVTSDNPRTEDPEAIITEIKAGISDEAMRSGRVQIESDRRKAIQKAAEKARAGDILLVAGKGHEDYQILGKKKVHFDDREEVFKALNS